MAFSWKLVLVLFRLFWFSLVWLKLVRIGLVSSFYNGSSCLPSIKNNILIHIWIPYQNLFKTTRINIHLYLQRTSQPKSHSYESVCPQIIAIHRFVCEHCSTPEFGEVITNLQSLEIYMAKSIHLVPIRACNCKVVLYPLKGKYTEL